MDRNKKGKIGGKSVEAFIQVTNSSQVRRAVAQLTRNGTPFRAEIESLSKSDEELASEALGQVCEKVRQAYTGSNVNPQPLINFLNTL